MYELKKKDRLCKNREYQLVYRHGKSYVARSVVLYIMKRSPQQPIRSGFVTGKKVGCAGTNRQKPYEVRYLRRCGKDDYEAF